jgi:catechol 2,3-dioxygenase-like lactoylglutathione lyase family enzyme
MKYVGTYICVKDVKTSRQFYENLFGLKVTIVCDEGISFDCGLSIMEGFAKLAGIAEDEIKYKTNNFELYFETDDFDNFMLKLSEYKDITFVHNIKEYDWGQRIIRFYDLDNHIIEVGESMDSVIKRFLKNGLSIEETAKISLYPVEYVRNLIE